MQRIADGVRRPLERFLQIEAASGIVLLVTAAIALAWANSPWAHAYNHLWHTSIPMRVGSWDFTKPLHFWVNDGLMTIFFFVAGLEIRRELHRGELSELQRAAVPLVAAVGGMIAPALIFAAFNAGHGGQRGWGVPMATDIAFAVGVLALLGPRVPAALRVLLLALAVIDDIGGILVIAIFYSDQFSIAGLALAAAAMLMIVVMQKLGVRRVLAYILPGIMLWAGMYKSGVHPTIGGVVLGLMTPVTSPTTDELSPVDRIQTALHGWVAYGIMPLFALANAGVNVGGATLEGDHWRVAMGLFLGLFVGKPLGITLATMVCAKLGWVTLPRGVATKGVFVVGVVGGIGFTVALFVGELAFTGTDYTGITKLSILLGSLASGVAGLILGRAMLQPQQDPQLAQSVDEAEASTEI